MEKLVTENWSMVAWRVRGHWAIGWRPRSLPKLHDVVAVSGGGVNVIVGGSPKGLKLSLGGCLIAYIHLQVKDARKDSG